MDSETGTESPNNDAGLAPSGEIGHPLWARHYGGIDYDEGNYYIHDWAHDVAALPGGGMVVAGAFVGEAVLQNSDSQMVFESADGAGDGDGLVVRLTADGEWAWAASIGGFGATGYDMDSPSDYVVSVGALKDGSITIFGWVEPEGVVIRTPDGETPFSVPDEGTFLARFDNTGKVAWTRYLGLDCSRYYGDRPTCDAVFDSEGAVYVTGAVGAEETVFGEGEENEVVLTAGDDNLDLVLARYQPDGSLDWVRQLGTPGFLTENARAMTLDDDGGVVMLLGCPGKAIQSLLDGSSIEAPADTESEAASWIARFAQTGEMTSLSHVMTWPPQEGDIALLPSGEIVVGGNFVSNVTFGDGEHKRTISTYNEAINDFTVYAYIALFDPSGNLSWVTTATGLSFKTVTALTGLDDGTILAAGYFLEEITFAEETPDPIIFVTPPCDSDSACRDMFLAHFLADGTLDWAVAFGGDDPMGVERPNDFALLDDGTIALVGEFGKTSTFFDGWSDPLFLTAVGMYDAFILKFKI